MKDKRATVAVAAVVIGAGVVGALWWSGAFVTTGNGAADPPDGGVAADASVAAPIDPSEPRLLWISPRRVTNQTSYPILIRGNALAGELRLSLRPEPAGAGVAFTVPTERLDDTHRVARLPASVEIANALGGIELKATLVGADGTPIAGQTSVVMINDADYPTPYAVASAGDGSKVFVASPSTDAVVAVDASSTANAAHPTLTTLAVSDGPRALAVYRSPDGHERLAVLCEWSGTLAVYDVAHLDAAPTTFTIAPSAQDVAVVASTHRAYVSVRTTDAVHEIDLGTGRTLRVLPVGVNPGPVAVDRNGRQLFVGNLGSSDVSIVDLATGAERRVSPEAGVPIIGGHTAPLAARVMGGKAPRDLVYSDLLGVLFVSNIGPNIGPNPERMEVSMNSGVTVIDVVAGRVVRHVSATRGVLEGLALDDARGVLLAADVATGQVDVFDADSLASADPSSARLTFAAITPPLGTPPLRPDTPAGAAYLSGPRAIALQSDGGRAFVVNRLTGALTTLDTSQAKQRTISVSASAAVLPMGQERERRLGETAFFTDVGNTRMTCDACHYEGREDGLLFTKDNPMHIYRVPTLRSIAESPPYFTPAMFPSLEYTARYVLTRNRTGHAAPTAQESRTLGAYQAMIVAPPNPYVGASGAFPATITLPDGREGNPRNGLAIFEREGSCTSCHPGPSYTTDQDPATRGRRYDVGTPVALPLRPDMQDDDFYDLPAPALIAVWDNYPLLESGAGGYSVEGDQVRATAPFALRRVVELARTPRAGSMATHGALAQLSPTEVDDLLAFLLTQ